MPPNVAWKTPAVVGKSLLVMPVPVRPITYALHGTPAQRWTLATLAARAGASRSVLAERFTLCVGQPPIQYLTQWRMQLATHLLAEPGAKVVAVAAAVGYESEAAFSRAFEKCAGVSPAVWRQRSVA
jgi:AraC-like DNA-binding protein